MKRFLILSVAISALTAPASASVWTDGISYDGIIDVVQDNSVSLALVDASPGGGPADGIISPGDIIAGLVKWNTNISDANTIGDHSLSVFAVEILSAGVAGSTTAGGDPTINFSNGPTAASVAALTALLPTMAAALPGGAFSASAVGINVSHVGGTDPTTLPLGAAVGLIDTTYAPDFEYGFADSGDYFEVEVRDHRADGPPGAWTGLPGGIGQDGVIDIRDTDGDGFANEFDDLVGAGPGLGIIPGVGVIGYESAAFSVLRDFTGPGPAYYLPIPTTTLAGGPGPGDGDAQVLVTPSTTFFQPTVLQSANGYSISDQSVIAINAVPEPASLLTWAGLMGLGVCSALLARRRRRTA
jgi:hypothetical protein